MNRRNVLIVYASKYGQTEKVAARIGSALEQRGHAIDLERVETLPSTREVAAYDGVMVGGSVYGGRHQAHLEKFVKDHLGELAKARTAFFSVSGAAGRDEAEGRERADAQVQDFQKETVWTPDLTAAIAGAFPYTRYGFFLRWMMKLLNHRSGAPTDTSRDHELTDWEQVARLATEFGDLLAEAGEPTPAGSVGGA